MPNWIEGSLKLRGTSENLKKFLTEGIDAPTRAFVEPKKLDDLVERDFSDTYCEVEFDGEVWVKDTVRAFIQKGGYAYWESMYATIVLPIKQAWSFASEGWASVAEKYDLDIRLYGFEKGMEFCQEVEIIKGKITKDDTIKYDDWEWECPMPMLGG